MILNGKKNTINLGSTAGAYDDWHEGNDPAGITTQDPKLMKRFDPVAGGRRSIKLFKSYDARSTNNSKSFREK